MAPTHSRRTALDWAGSESNGAVRAVAAIAALVLVFKVPGTTLFPVLTLLLGIVLAPIVVRKLTTFQTGRVLLPLALIALLNGVVLRLTVEPTVGTNGSLVTAVTLSTWLLTIPIGVGLAWWAKDQLGPIGFVRLVVFGGLLSALLIEQPFSWKGNTGVYITLMVLAVLPVRRAWLVRGTLAVSALLSSVSDARFMSLIAIVVLISTFVGGRARAHIARHPLPWIVIIVASLIALAQGALVAMRSGLLGPAIAARTIAQTAGGRSIVEGSRTEWAATLHLFEVHPWGFGLGEITNGGLAREAIAHVQSVGGDYTAQYFIVDVFGQRVDLHSIVADLWYHFGAGGVLFGAVALVLLVGSLPKALGLPIGMSALVLFAVFTGVWDLFFSPMPESDRLMLALILGALSVTGYFKPQDLVPVHLESGSAPDRAGTVR
ncbi:hypothetical protein ACVKXF_000178 [Curtobacterium sp. PvP017]